VTVIITTTPRPASDYHTWIIPVTCSSQVKHLIVQCRWIVHTCVSGDRSEDILSM